MKISEIIKQKKKRLNQKEIARKYNVTAGYISHLMTGRRHNKALLEKIYDDLKKEGLI